jgi:hypothetical protein
VETEVADRVELHAAEIEVDEDLDHRPVGVKSPLKNDSPDSKGCFVDSTPTRTE